MEKDEKADRRISERQVLSLFLFCYGNKRGTDCDMAVRGPGILRDFDGTVCIKERARVYTFGVFGDYADFCGDAVLLLSQKT